MHIIGKHNYDEASDAIRDILMTYVELVEATAGFSHNADVYVRFNPFKFVDADVEESSYYADLDLLRAGSAIAILCAFYNVWTEEQELDGHPLTRDYKAAVSEKGLARFPDIDAVISEAILRNSAPLEDQWMNEAVAPIYRKYVVGFFAKLAKDGGSAA